jgi:hypothetical protein
VCGYVPMPCLEAACDGLDTIGPGVESVGSFSGRPARSFTFPELSARRDHGTRCGNAMLKSVNRRQCCFMIIIAIVHATISSCNNHFHRIIDTYAIRCCMPFAETRVTTTN